MLAILNSLNAYNFPIFRLILMICVSKFMVHRALSDKTYLSLGFLSPFSMFLIQNGYLNGYLGSFNTPLFGRINSLTLR